MRRQFSKLRALFFDLDGTLVKSDDLHREGFRGVWLWRGFVLLIRFLLTIAIAAWVSVLEHIKFPEKTNQRLDLAFYQKHICGFHNDRITDTLLSDPVLFPEFKDVAARRRLADLKETLVK